MQGLWDSWEDDALVADKASGRFVDPDRLHRLDHQGEFFQVRGPLNIRRSRQGQPVIFQAGASDDGRSFAAKRAEVIFTHAETLEEGQTYYADVKARAKGFGRDPEQLFILPGASAIVGDTTRRPRRSISSSSIWNRWRRASASSRARSTITTSANMTSTRPSPTWSISASTASRAAACAS